MFMDVLRYAYRCICVININININVLGNEFILPTHHIKNSILHTLHYSLLLE